MRVSPVRVLLGALLIVAVAGFTAVSESAQVEVATPDATHRDVRQLSRPRPAPETESTSRPPQPPIFTFFEAILDVFYFFESIFQSILCFLEGFFFKAGSTSRMCSPCSGTVVFMGPVRYCRP